MRKVSFSASYFDVPKIREVLRGCDLIYTTNVMARDQLYDLFTSEHVAFIPPGCELTVFLKGTIQRDHPDCEIIGFGDLYKMFNTLVAGGHSETIIVRKEYLGWTTCTRGVANSLWQWERPMLKELGPIIGDAGKVPRAVKQFHAARGY